MKDWLAGNFLLVTLFFVAGTLAVSFAAARAWPARPFRAAILAGLSFETILLLMLRPGLSAAAVSIAVACTALLAAIGGRAGRRAGAHS